MKKYVDCDGVIFDSIPVLFDEEYSVLSRKKDFNEEKYVQQKNWDLILRKSEIINEAINILKELKDVIILTKVNSLENEAVSKIRIFRELEIKNDIILVPYNLKKTDVVSAESNILVDDTIHNLDEWKKSNGIPIFFNKNNLDIDGWGSINKNYTKIKSLEYLKRFE